jgi:GNAT superfamily N-acetyltransferase
VDIRVRPVEVGEILPWRELHRGEMRCQIVHDSLHERGLTEPYLVEIRGVAAGYGTVVGFGDEPKETIDELYLAPEHRGLARHVFSALIEASGATRVQAQTNDPQLLTMLFDRGRAVVRDRLLFEDGTTTALSVAGARLRPLEPSDEARTLNGKPLKEAGTQILEVGGAVVAAGGVLFHYNPPYGDLYMEVAEDRRRRGYGSFLVQELKRICREMGKLPAARCGVDNVASRATLEKAGMHPCGAILTATVVAQTDGPEPADAGRAQS